MPYKTGFNKTETDSVIFQENLTKLCPFQGKVIFCLRYSKTKKESKFIFTPRHNSYRLCQILPLKNNTGHKTDYEIKTLSTARHNTDKHEQLQDKSITVTFQDKSKTNQRANYCQFFFISFRRSRNLRHHKLIKHHPTIMATSVSVSVATIHIYRIQV